MDAVNIFASAPAFSADTIDFIQNIQLQINQKISEATKTEMLSVRNDLGCQINRQGVEKLITYRNIFEGIMNCNSCYKDFDIEDLISVAKQEISRN